jgi:hypothetical protein
MLIKSKKMVIEKKAGKPSDVDALLMDNRKMHMAEVGKAIAKVMRKHLYGELHSSFDFLNGSYAQTYVYLERESGSSNRILGESSEGAYHIRRVEFLTKQAYHATQPTGDGVAIEIDIERKSDESSLPLRWKFDFQQLISDGEVSGELERAAVARAPAPQAFMQPKSEEDVAVSVKKALPDLCKKILFGDIVAGNEDKSRKTKNQVAEPVARGIADENNGAK